MNKKWLKNEGLLPKHIAFIIDGNGRWAKHRGLPRMIGHKAGFETLKKTIENVYNLHIPYVSIYAFSCENWNRPKEEVDGLMNLFRKAFSEDSLSAKEKDIRVIFSGDIEKLDADLCDNCKKIACDTENNAKMTLNFCINYGGRQEIIRAINSLLDEKIETIDIENFKSYLYTKDIPDVDYIVRTSGENRTSNFMPFQATYSELYFPKVLWPDFNLNQLHKALSVYAKRDRRYGAIKG